MAKTLLATSITPTVNPTISMISTKDGMFMVKNSFLTKRGYIAPKANEIQHFSEPTMVVIEEHKKGSYLFSGDGTATQDSSRTKKQVLGADCPAGEESDLMYYAGETPKENPNLLWDSDGVTVKTFIRMADYKAQVEIELLEKQLANA